MKFEVLCIDQKGKVLFKNEEKFLDALSINDELWSNDLERNYEQKCIRDRERDLHLKVDSIDTSKVVADLFSSAFIVTVEASFDTIEPYRLKLLKHLRYLGFNHLRILTCDTSANIAEKIYPNLGRIENLLRRYIVKFFITKIGLGWFDISVSNEVKLKVKQRRDNEAVFTKSQIVDADVTLIDFNELGEIITRQTSVFSKVEDVIEKINRASSLDDLKHEVSGHYPKYFKTIFEKQNFESKWKTLFDIRNKVAHHNYLVAQDLEDSERLVLELIEMLSEAEDKIDDAVLNITEKQAITKAIQDVATEQIQLVEPSVSQNEGADAVIDLEVSPSSVSDKDSIIIRHFTRPLTEDLFVELLRDFRSQKRSFSFIALSLFLNHLEEKGYNRQIASSIASILSDKGRIKIDYIDNPYGPLKTATITEVG